jgi:hypothetical protein
VRLLVVDCAPMSESFLLVAAARSLDARPTAADDGRSNAVATANLLGDKEPIRRTLVQHVVRTMLADFPGRQFEHLDILELGSGAGFFAHAYAEVWPEAPRLTRLMQTDAHPRDEHVRHLNVCDLASLAGQTFDAVLSIDFVSCLAFGAGLDPDDDDDYDALSALQRDLHGLLKQDGRFYDFMASMPNSQFVCRFVPDYCQGHPGRFISIYDTGHESKSDEEGGCDQLLFVTFGTGLVQHEDVTGGLGLLHLAGRQSSISFEALCESLQLKKAKTKKRELKNLAFSKEVVGYLLRDINAGGCPDNWELLSYCYVDPAHFEEVFEEPAERMLPVFQQTLGQTVRFLRATLKDCEGYEEITLVEAYKAVVLRHFADYDVGFDEADVTGADGGRYKQAYHCARVYEGSSAASGAGSCRCLMTRICKREAPRV